ncbi:Protein FAR1-RELATED SEQUENCE 5 [Glycine max]|nr:Protein FAR1-RELATED SEQUENCE 5 [Glycine max]
MRFDTHTGSRRRNSFVLIGCERSDQYKSRKKEFVRRDIGSMKCGCPFRLRGKPVHGGEGWMVKLIWGIHNHELVKSLVGHPYTRRLTKDEKNIIADMTKSMDEVVVHDLFWCHPGAVKLCNACHLVFFIDNTYKTNRYKLPLLDFVGVTPTRMTFSAGFAYLEGERVNNVVWALERRDRLLVVIVTDRDLTLINAVKTVFPECINLLCRFHIYKNVKAKCKSLIDQKMLGSMSWITRVVWLIVLLKRSSLRAFRSLKWLVHLSQCSLTMLTKHGLSHTRKNLLQPKRISVESAHWALKRVLHNSLGDLCSVWDAMNIMIML